MTKYGEKAKLKPQKKMKINRVRACLAALSALFMAGCDNNTSTLGIPSRDEEVFPSYGTFQAYTRSEAMDSVLGNSTRSYLGSIDDPETGTRIRADFAAQFHTFENYSFPKREFMFPDDGKNHDVEPVKCDSVEIRLYFDSYYGEKNAPLKLEIYQLDKDNVMEENEEYYTDTDLKQYVKAGSLPIATKIFTPEDYNLADAERESSTHSDNVRIILPDTLGSQIMNTYYAHPEYFKDSYTFIRKVCPGFLFKIKSGNGSMLSVEASTLNVYFSYYHREKRDSLCNGLGRFAATPEVIQSTQFSNDNMQSLVDEENGTYLKTPAGIYTEVQLPVSEIYKGHETDSVSKAQLTFTRYNNTNPSTNSLGIPMSLLLVRKKDMTSFFKNRSVSDSKSSYTTSYSSTYNTYTFNNICRLISLCQHEKKAGMAVEGLSEEEWEQKHPDWNKAVLIPVSISTTSDTYGNTHQVSVTHDMGMNSIRLQGGPHNPINMQVIYSRFRQ